jgi:hypothetical protein
MGCFVRVFHSSILPFLGGEPLITPHSPEEMIARLSAFSKRVAGQLD